tara:strand:+ start:435 stop:1070 length:636 start_codon:yes stop_codon:yes gene_type:complete
MDLFGSWTEIGMILAAVAAGAAAVLVPLIKSRKNKQPKGVTMDGDFWKVHSTVHERLTQLRIESDCARSQIAQFHNGGHFLDGVSMMKFTITHESLGVGIQGEGHLLQDSPLSMYMPRLQLALRDEPIIYMVRDFEDSYCKQQMENSGVIAFAILPLRHGAKGVIGYLSCQWCKWDKVDGLDFTKAAHDLEEARNSIEVHLVQQIATNSVR